MKKILIAEDSAATLSVLKEVLAEILSHESVSLFEATDGAKALDIIKKEKPSLLILDIIMPHLNGIEVLRKMQTMNVDTKTLIISAVDKEELVEDLEGLPLEGYITKPFDINEVRREVRRVLQL